MRRWHAERLQISWRWRSWQSSVPWPSSQDPLSSESDLHLHTEQDGENSWWKESLAVLSKHCTMIISETSLPQPLWWLVCSFKTSEPLRPSSEDSESTWTLNWPAAEGGVWPSTRRWWRNNKKQTRKHTWPETLIFLMISTSDSGWLVLADKLDLSREEHCWLTLASLCKTKWNCPKGINWSNSKTVRLWFLVY